MGEVSSQLLPLSSQQLPAAVWNLWPLAQSPSPVVLSCVYTFQLNHIHPGRLSTGLRPPPPHTLSWTDSFLSAGGSSHCTLPWSCLLRTSTPALGSRTTWAGGWGQGRGFLGEDGKGMGLHGVPSHVDEGGGQQKANSSSWASWASASHPRAFTQGLVW